MLALLSFESTSIELHVFARKEFDRHVVDGVHLLFQHNGLEERLYARVALPIGMLGNKKRDAALAYTLFIFRHHVVAHYLYVAAIGVQQEFAYEVGL